MEEEKDVNEVSQASPVSEEKIEQAQDISEDVKPQEAGVQEEYDKVKSNLKNVRAALKIERERLEAMRNIQPERAVETSEPRMNFQDGSNDDAVARFLRAEANSLIAIKLQTDPSFKDRIDIVRTEMEMNPSLNVEEADSRVKSRLFDEIVKATNSGSEAENFNSIKSGVTSEPQVRKTTGDPIKDLLTDPSNNPYMKEAIKRRFGV